MSARRVLELYRLRWQVELGIKREKSLGDMDELPNRRPDTVYTYLCGKLLGTLVLQRVTSGAAAISPPGQ